MTILRRVPKFELPGTPAREFSKRLNLVSIEGVYRPTSRNLLKELHRENLLEKSRRLKTAHVHNSRWVLKLGSWVPQLGSFERHESW